MGTKEAPTSDEIAALLDAISAVASHGAVVLRAFDLAEGEHSRPLNRHDYAAVEQTCAAFAVLARAAGLDTLGSAYAGLVERTARHVKKSSGERRAGLRTALNWMLDEPTLCDALDSDALEIAWGALRESYPNQAVA